MSRRGMSRLMLVLSLGLFIAFGPSCSGEKAEEEKPVEANETYKGTVNVVCSNNLTPMLMEIPFDITITADEKAKAGVGLEHNFTGKAYFPAELLTLALILDPLLEEITLNDLQVTYIVRSGATGGPIVLGSSVATPATFTIPPVTTDSQTCEDAGFITSPCVLEGMEMQFNTVKETLTPDAAGTDILIGIDDSRIPLPDLPIFPDSPGPLGPTGMRVSITIGANTLLPALECSMGSLNDNGTSNPNDDFVDPLADDALLAIPVI